MRHLLKLFKKGTRLITDRPYKKGSLIYNRYAIKNILGIGSYGTTYLCHDRVNEQSCVVKQMTKSKRKTFIYSMYQQETDILSQLNHPNIPVFYERFTYQNNLCFAMQYIEGESLEDILFLQKKRVDEISALKLIKSIVNIVDYIHSMNIVHGDLRTPNVILRNNMLYLIDFGLSDCLDNLKNNTNKVERFKEDFFDIGELLLFLLYSDYNGKVKKRSSWKDELTLHPKTSELLHRLLEIERSYLHAREILVDIHIAIDALDKNA